MLETESLAPVIGKRMEVIKQKKRSISDTPVYSTPPPIRDQFGRTFNYLRIALNEHCNLRCIYCMPEDGIFFRTEEKLLSSEEIYRVVKLFSNLGVTKIRFTGGEPLLRRDLPNLIQYAKYTAGIDSIHLTTNGLLLGKNIETLENSGLSGINISLDTLKPEKFRAITRRDGLKLVLDGFEKAVQSTIQSIKLNMVAMRDFNNDELMDFVELTKENDITVRFIELMPFDSHQIWKTGKFYGADHIVADLKKQIPDLEIVDGTRTEHHVFQVNGYRGKVAVIPSYSRTLCDGCNRIRITADGKLLNCLYSQEETNLRDAMRVGKMDKRLEEMIKNTMWKKFQDGWDAQRCGKDHRESMTQIGG